MVPNRIKRNMSLFVILTLFFSLMLTGVQASNVETETITQNESASDSSSAVQEVQIRMQALLEQYSITANMTDEEIVNSIIAADGDKLKSAIQEIDEIEAMLGALSMEDAYLFDMQLLNTYDRFYQNLQRLMTPALLAEDIGTIQNGEIGVTATHVNSDSYGEGKCTISGATITIIANGDRGSDGRVEQVVTISNNTGSDAKLSFNYTINSKGDYIKIDGVAITENGSWSGTLNADKKSVTITMKGQLAAIWKGQDAKLTLIDIKLEPILPSSDVTVQYNDSLGSVKVDNVEKSNGAIVEDITLGSSIILEAIPNNGSTFLGWVDTDGKILQTDTAYTLSPTTNVTVKAVFGGSNTACFGVGSNNTHTFRSGFLNMTNNTYYSVNPAYVFDNLNDAIAKAANSDFKSIVLLTSGTLAAGTYTIPTGVTLLIPFDSNNTLYTNTPQYKETPSTGDSYVQPTAYRTLTMAEGANLIVNGSLSLSAKHRATNGAQLNGNSPTDAASFIHTNAGSTITVNDGGVLYAWGYITGSGTVTAKNGATVYEYFQLMDFRGGDQSTNTKNRVFPFSQYYVQNIEVPLTLEYGASEYAYLTANALGSYFCSSVQFIGPSNCVFNLTKGSCSKYYDGATDRLTLSINGDLTLAAVVVDLGQGKIDSSEYDFAINGNMTVTVKSGSNVTLNQSLALLPGSKFIIESGATCTLGSNQSVYAYDVDNWGTYCGAVNKTVIPVGYAPGRTYSRTDADLADAIVQIDGFIDASAGYIYTTCVLDENGNVTSGGANICSSGTGKIKTKEGTQTVTHQIIQAGDPDNSAYPEIPLTPAKLKHGDGTYLTSGTNTYVYNADTNRWECSTADNGTGHTLADATCSAPKTCSVCGATEGEPTGAHIDADRNLQCDNESCKVPLATLESMNAYADSTTELVLKFRLHDSLLNSDKTGFASVENSSVTASVDFALPEGSECETHTAFEDGLFVVTQPIASGEMTKPVTVSFKSGENIVPIISYADDTCSDSVARKVTDYAKALLGLSADQVEDAAVLANQKALVTALLTYGSYAQNYFTGKTNYEDLTGLELTSDALGSLPVLEESVPDTYKVEKPDASGGIQYTSQKGFLGSAIKLRVYFDQIEGYSFTLQFRGRKYDVPASEENGQYFVEILNIPAAYLNEIYTITATKDTETYVVKTSVMAYLNDAIAENSADANLINLTKAIWAYNQAAREFFGLSTEEAA